MRIRTIKPEFFLHEGLYDLEQETGLPIRVAFAGLWCAADRDGRFKWEPRRLGIQILPWDQCDFSRVLDALTTRGLIVRYASGTGDFGWIPTFSKHQVINNRERPSELPDPLECKQFDACPTRAPRVHDASQGEGKGKEHGREGKGKDSLSDKSDDYPEIIKTLWPIFPATSRNRSSLKKLTEAWGKTKPKPEDDKIIESARKWASCHDWTKDGGQYAPGAHVWMKDRKWESEPEQPTNGKVKFAGMQEELEMPDA
jgi:hypothetical protein